VFPYDFDILFTAYALGEPYHPEGGAESPESLLFGAFVAYLKVEAALLLGDDIVEWLEFGFDVHLEPLFEKVTIQTFE
jgi:hypothetical protein